MALTGKVETDVHIKSSAAKFHDMFTHKPHHISNVSGSNIQGCDLHEGDWGTVGTIVCWNYVHDGKACVAKEKIEAIDAEKNLVTFRVLEGDLMDHYKSFVITLQANPKDEVEGCTVHWTMEYEKHHGDITDPHTLLQLAVEVSNDIDAHLTADVKEIDTPMANSKFGKVETHIDIKACAERFYDIWLNKPHQIPNMITSHTRARLTSVDVHGDDRHSGGKVGTLSSWNYVQDGKAKVAEEIIESIERENKSVTWKVIGGDLLEHYKSFKFILQITTQNGDQALSVAYWILEYEKVNDNVPDPHGLLQLVIDVNKDVDAHLNT
ncbi:MLP-like protein 34 [Argentina anserina]|uniref:MLP-like protein 34 n=1 Tax=Argentina anserina TaxID=57926 RepID=UPI00217693D8|nr:MLP-like protein 34 [Potentilla anserina]